MPNPNGSFTLHDGPPYANGSLHMGDGLIEGEIETVISLIFAVQSSTVDESAEITGVTSESDMRVLNQNEPHQLTILGRTLDVTRGHALNKILKDIINKFKAVRHLRAGLGTSMQVAFSGIPCKLRDVRVGFSAWHRNLRGLHSRPHVERSQKLRWRHALHLAQHPL